MTFEEFENTLQDWLDEGRLDEADALVAKVCEADRPQCEELLFAYRSLFAGLAASAPEELAERPQPQSTVATAPAGSRWNQASLPGLALALALCLTLVAFVPGMLPETGSDQVAPVNALTTTTVTPPLLPRPIETTLPIEQREYARLTTVSFAPIARSMASQTDMAFKSLNQFGGSVAVDFNPIDDQFAVYQEAAPLINTLTRSLMPGTHSLTNAFSLLQEKTDTAPAIQVDPAAPAPLEAAENASVI
ncbi:hypothetical protein AB1L30_03140 [Bremerella sp. JC817]|uniref:hypothetical protein n=1 Tax=Bremerella sp. JC817 TaxID=3231756 RepID=UPI003457E5FE